MAEKGGGGVSGGKGGWGGGREVGKDGWWRDAKGGAGKGSGEKGEERMGGERRRCG